MKAYLGADELRDLLKKRIDDLGWSVAFTAQMAQGPDGTRGIHRNTAYSALKCEDPWRRAGTIERLLEATGYTVERCFRVTKGPDSTGRHELHPID